MIDCSLASSLTRRARELGISHGSVYYISRSTLAADLAIMRRINAAHVFSVRGSCMLRALLAAEARDAALSAA